MIDFNNEDDEEKKKRSISERTKSIMAMSGMKPIEHNTTNFDIEDNSINISERTKNIMAMSGMKPIEEYILQDTKDFNDLINPNDNNQEYNISRKENDVSDDESIQDYYNTNENFRRF